jgi:molybdenum cofactor synthesis domain-containing protein
MMFRKLLTFEQAQQSIKERIGPSFLGAEKVPLLEANGRVIAEDVTAKIDIPPFSRSTVDGYAVKSKDTFGADEKNPATLKVCGAVPIGKMPKIKVTKLAAAEIVTGAPIPNGADAVVMVEHTERTEDSVRVFTAVARNSNITKAGADIEKGETVLKSGAVITSRAIGVLAALGKSEVKVYRVPCVAVLSTGPEITEPGKTLLPGEVYDINAYTLSSAVLEAGGKPLYMGVFPDDLEALKSALKHASSSADIVVTSGGVSVGPKDIMPKALTSLDDSGIILSGIAIKPGKPTTIGLVGKKPVFLLPGHPTSALLVFYLFVRPMIRLMSGWGATVDSQVKATAGARMFSAKGRKTFIMVTLKQDRPDKVLALPVSSGDSGAITTLAKADGFVVVPENVQFVDSDEEVMVNLFEKGFRA